jgi:crossover junction endodeoxyribonuclease RusA
MSHKAERDAWTAFVEAGGNAQAAVDALCKPRTITFTVLCKPAPQGSLKGIALTSRAGLPYTKLSCDNPRTMPYRQAVGWAALEARAKAGIHEVFAAQDVPVRMAATFVFLKPKSAPRSRTRPTVKPDLDKLLRSTYDALSGVLYADDAQVVSCALEKIYGAPESVTISVTLQLEEGY